MSDFKVAPKGELTINQLRERYQLNDITPLKDWAKLHGIDTQHGVFSPQDVELLDHSNHHIRVLGMSITEYKGLLQGFNYKNEPQETVIGSKVEKSVKPELNHPQLPQEMEEAVEVLTEQYSEAIDFLGERIAENFIEELDQAVMRHLVTKVRQRQKTMLNSQEKPNSFLQTIKNMMGGRKGSLFLPKADDPSVELDGNHRLS